MFKPRGRPVIPVHRFGARTAVVRLAGACQASVVERVISAIAEVVENDRTVLVLDLCEATQVDAAFLEALHDLRGAGDRFGWDVVLVRPRLKDLWTYFELADVAQTFVHFGTQAGALEYALAREVSSS